MVLTCESVYVWLPTAVQGRVSTVVVLVVDEKFHLLLEWQFEEPFSPFKGLVDHLLRYTVTFGVEEANPNTGISYLISHRLAVFQVWGEYA